MHITSVLFDDTVVAVISLGFGSLLSRTRFKNFALMVKVAALMITMAKHYVQTHPEFKEKLSHEVKAELDSLYHKTHQHQLVEGNKTGAKG